MFHRTETNIFFFAGYILEYKLASSNTWTKVATVDANILQYCFEKLKQKTDVILKVTAENMVGVGLPATSDIVNLHKHASEFLPHQNIQTMNILIKHMTFSAVPSPPTAPLEIRMTGSNSIIIEWGQPESDGGSPLLGYNIAIRDLKKTMWIEVGRVTESVQKFNIKDLQENHEYLIRIYARNEIGSSEPLESDEPFKAVPCLGKSLKKDDLIMCMWGCR